MKIIKIHGCSGAGKTTAARSLIENAVEGEKTLVHLPLAEGYGKPLGKNAAVTVYSLKLKGVAETVFLLGNYDGLACGGVDGVSDFRHIFMLLENFHSHGHIVFEGLLQSTYYGKMGEHSLKFGKDYIYAFIDTPVDVCLQRVEARRAAAGNKGKFNPQNTRDKHSTVAHTMDRVRSLGHTVVVLNHDKSMFPQLVELLR